MTTIKAVFEFDPQTENPQLTYFGHGLVAERLRGEGRPGEGHLSVRPFCKIAPAPTADEADLIIIRGAIDGVSRSGLTVYGQGNETWRRSHIRLAMGHIVSGFDLRVVTVERGTGRRDEAHCASDAARIIETQLGDGEGVLWLSADAHRSVAIVGVSTDIWDLEEISETVTEKWLPTRAARRRIGQNGPFGDIQEALLMIHGADWHCGIRPDSDPAITLGRVFAVREALLSGSMTPARGWYTVGKIVEALDAAIAPLAEVFDAESTLYRAEQALDVLFSDWVGYGEPAQPNA